MCVLIRLIANERTFQRRFIKLKFVKLFSKIIKSYKKVLKCPNPWSFWGPKISERGQQKNIHQSNKKKLQNFSQSVLVWRDTAAVKIFLRLKNEIEGLKIRRRNTGHPVINWTCQPLSIEFEPKKSFRYKLKFIKKSNISLNNIRELKTLYACPVFYCLATITYKQHVWNVLK